MMIFMQNLVLSLFISLKKKKKNMTCGFFCSWINDFQSMLYFLFRNVKELFAGRFFFDCKRMSLMFFRSMIHVLEIFLISIDFAS